MKLPRLSNPKIIYRDEDTVIEASSAFDYLTATQQWIVFLFLISPIIIMGIYLLLLKKGVL